MEDRFILKTFKREIEQLVAVGAPYDSVLSKLNEYLNPLLRDDNRSMLIMISAQVNRLASDQMKGLISQESYNMGMARFNHNVLSMLKSFEQYEKLGILYQEDQPTDLLSNGFHLRKEKVLEDSSFFSVDWLRQGEKAIEGVCKIIDPYSRSSGSGFLLPGGYIMTNHHVISSDLVAEGIKVMFNYQEKDGEIGQTLSKTLDVQSPYYLNSELDVAIFKLNNTDGIEHDGFTLETNPLPKEGQPVTILQHPQGRPKELTIGSFCGEEGIDISYNASTDSGSSGSPVFNQQWQIIGLHYGAHGQKAINKGVKISAILDKMDPSIREIL